MSDLNAQTFGETPYIVSPPSNNATQFAFSLKGYVFGLRLMRTDYFGYIDDDRYAVYTDIRTSGLGALLKTLEIWSVTKGQVHEDGTLRPQVHIQQNLNTKNRRVEMIYDDEARSVETTILPPLGSQGIPPASPEQRYSALDTVTAMLHMTRKGRPSADDLCKGSVPVFDSKQHYMLRLEPVGQARVKYLGEKQEAIHCHVYYEPVSGYDPEDKPSDEEAATPIHLYFAYNVAADMHIPVRFTYKISGFTAVIKMSDLRVMTPDTEM